MATIRKFECINCKEEKNGSGYLFEDLKIIADKSHKYDKCGQDLILFITFNFGLGVGECKFKINDVFYPENIDDLQWKDDNDADVTYYPFLVVMSNVDRVNEQSFWLPYWHEVKTVEEKYFYKYGQWAPVIDMNTFNSLLTQAKSKGYKI